MKDTESSREHLRLLRGILFWLRLLGICTIVMVVFTVLPVVAKAQIGIVEFYVLQAALVVIGFFCFLGLISWGIKLARQKDDEE